MPLPVTRSTLSDRRFGASEIDRSARATTFTGDEQLGAPNSDHPRRLSPDVANADIHRCRRGWRYPLEPLPSLVDLPAGSFADALVVVATHMAGPLHPFSVSSHRTRLHGEGLDVLSSDPFSFAGGFPFEGLTTIRGKFTGTWRLHVPATVAHSKSSFSLARSRWSPR
jgi:hypothetical protein